MLKGKNAVFLNRLVLWQSQSFRVWSRCSTPPSQTGSCPVRLSGKPSGRSWRRKSCSVALAASTSLEPQGRARLPASTVFSMKWRYHNSTKTAQKGYCFVSLHSCSIFNWNIRLSPDRACEAFLLTHSDAQWTYNRIVLSVSGQAVGCAVRDGKLHDS